MKWYFTLSRFQEVELHHQTKFSAILKMGSYPSVGDRITLFYATPSGHSSKKIKHFDRPNNDCDHSKAVGIAFKH